MIPTLRKRHRQIWLGLAVTLPLLFVAAVLLIPRPAYQEKLYQPAEKEVQGQPVAPDTTKEQDQ